MASYTSRFHDLFSRYFPGRRPDIKNRGIVFRKEWLKNRLIESIIDPGGKLKNKSASITLDNETFRIAEKLAKRFNKSIPDIVKDLIKKEKDLTDIKITKGVKKISGILKTDYDYKALRDMCVADRMVKYESID